MQQRIRTDDQGRYRRQLAATALVVSGLAVAAMYVVFVLPDRVTHRPPESAKQGAPQVASRASPIAEAVTSKPIGPPSVAGQSEAIERMAAVSRSLVTLEGEGVRTWGTEDIGGASIANLDDAISRAKSDIAAKRYGEAGAGLTDAERILRSLADGKESRFVESVAAGRSALDRLDADGAARRFKIALAIHPNDQSAADGMARANGLPEALAQIAAGDAAVDASNLAAARTAYARALQIDPKIESIRPKLRDVEDKLASQEFQSALAATYARLKAGDPKAAESALQRAQKIRPAAPEIAELRRQVAAASRDLRISGLRAEAAWAETEERWRDASTAYTRVLELDPSAAFAVRGKPAADRMSEINSAIDAYIAEPGRLASADPRAHARSLVQAASDGGPGPVLKSKIGKLGELLAAAQAPVRVVLRSDGNTAIDILRSGSLGAFEVREISLPPGQYTAVGRRSGYRDVRVQFVVSSGSEGGAVLVQCTERIRQ